MTFGGIRVIHIQWDCCRKQSDQSGRIGIESEQQIVRVISKSTQIVIVASDVYAISSVLLAGPARQCEATTISTCYRQRYLCVRLVGGCERLIDRLHVLT